jgi:hypothetical protein
MHIILLIVLHTDYTETWRWLSSAFIIIRAIALMMAAVSTSETKVSFFEAKRHVPVDHHVQTRRNMNL